MGCVASKDGVEMNCESRLVQPGRRSSIPLTARGNSDTGYHMVALTSSTYGILKVEDTKNDCHDKNLVNKPDSSHDAYHEKLKSLDVHEDLVPKTWSEFSRNLPKIPPSTKAGTTLPSGNIRGMNNQRLTESTSFRGVSESPRRLHSLASRHDNETINMCESMEGLTEIGTAKPKPKLMKRTSSFPVMKPFERSVTFTTIHTVSELDSDDPTKAISLGLNGDVVNGYNSVDSSGTENTKPVRTALMPTISSVVPKRDDMTKLMPLSIAPLRKATTVTNYPVCSRQAVTLPQGENSSQQETSIVTTTGLPLPLSPILRNIAFEETTACHTIAHPRQPHVAEIILVSEENDSMQARNKPTQLRPTKFSVSKRGKSAPLNTIPGVEVVSASHKEQLCVSSRLVQSKGITSSDPDVESNGAIDYALAFLSHESDVVPPESASRRFELDLTSIEAAREVPRFESPISVLSLAASFELQNGKNSKSQEELHAPPESLGFTMRTACRDGLRSSQPYSEQQRVLNPFMSTTSCPGQGARQQPQDCTCNLCGHVSCQAYNITEGCKKVSKLSNRDFFPSRVQVLGEGARHSKVDEASVEDKSSVTIVKPPSPEAGKCRTGALKPYVTTNSCSSLIVEGIEDSEMDSDLLASFEEALQMFSTEKWNEMKDSKSEAVLPSGEAENYGQSPMSPVRLEDEFFSGKIRRGNEDQGVAVTTPDPWAKFERKCPPAGEGRIVLYTTTLRGIRKTFEDCNKARFILESYNVEIDERDVSIHAEFRLELKELAGKSVSVPHTFIKGRCVGDVDTLTRLHEDGTLASFVDGVPSQKSREECDGCGGIRFVPCSNCSGSTKVVIEANVVVRCGECNENGLMRCPICN